jgi:hypothetical protein
MTKKDCDFCKEEARNIFDFEMLQDWFGGFCGDAPITSENAVRENHAIFIDRGYLRLVDIAESQCMDHGEKVKINFCPFCGRSFHN